MIQMMDRYANDLAAYGDRIIEDKELERSMIRRSQRGDERCGREVVEGYLPLVVKTVHETISQVALNRGMPFTYQDLYSVAATRLMNAVKTFNCDNEDCSFYGYALVAMRHGLWNYIQTNNAIVRAPREWGALYRQMNKIKEEEGIEDVGELATRMGVSENRLNDIIVFFSYSYVHLDANIVSDGSSSTNHDMISDSKASLEFQSASASDLRMFFERASKEVLTAQEEKVVRLYMGFDEPPKTFRGMADDTGTSYGRNQQVYKKAMKKLRKFFETRYENLEKTRNKKEKARAKKEQEDKEQTLLKSVYGIKKVKVTVEVTV